MANPMELFSDGDCVKHGEYLGWTSPGDGLQDNKPSLYSRLVSGKQIEGDSIAKGLSGLQGFQVPELDSSYYDDEKSMESILHGILDVKKFLSFVVKFA